MRVYLSLVFLAVPYALFAQDEPVRLTRDGSFKQHLQWSPDGSRMLLTRLHEGKLAIWSLRTTDGGDFKRLVSKDTPHFDGSWSTDGKRVIFVLDILQGTDGKLQIDTINADGTDQKTVIPHKAFEQSPRWSPDGQAILWCSTRDGNPELYTCKADGSQIKRLTSEVAFDHHPCWSPKGDRIAFTSSRTGKQKIYTMKADGSDVKRITDGEGIDAWPVWSPDGQHLAFTSNRDGNYEIYMVGADGTQLRNLTNHRAKDSSPAFSTDGKRIAFVSNRSGGDDIYIIANPAGR